MNAKLDLRNLIIQSFNHLSNDSDFPYQLLSVPKIRQSISTLYLSQFQNTTVRSSIEGNQGQARNIDFDNQKSIQPSKPSNIRVGTINHNVASVFGGLGTHERGAELTELAIRIVPVELRKSLRVLHVGPRNVNEILVSMLHTNSPDQVAAIDLFPTSPLITQGDMHHLPYGESEFDIIILGWVIPYSTDPILAVREIMRVAKHDSIIAIGVDYDVDQCLDTVGQHLAPWEDALLYKSSQSIINLFKSAGFYTSRIHFRKDATFPYSHIGKQIIFIGSFSKFPFASVSHHHLEEARAVAHLRSSGLTFSNSEAGRLQSHQHQAEREFCDDCHDPKAYLSMRGDFLSKSQLDSLISQCISLYLPWKSGSASQLGFPKLASDSYLSSVEIAKQITDVGFYEFPFLLSTHIVDRINDLYGAQSLSENSGRLFLDEDTLLSSYEILITALSEEFIEISGEFLKCVPILDTLGGMITFPIAEQHQSNVRNILSKDAQLFHFDKDRIKWLKFFIYLTDVDSEDCGAHVLLPGTTRCRIPLDGRLSDHEAIYISQQIPADDPAYGLGPKVFIGQAGKIFAVDTSNLHRGSQVLKGCRRVLEIQYTNSLFGQIYGKKPYKKLIPRFIDAITAAPRIFSRFQ